MMITDLISITELSRITFKSRPTLYKYISDYESGHLDEIPYSFIVLFDMANDDMATKSKIVEYCRKTYTTLSTITDKSLNELFTLISNNKDKLDLDEVKNYIEELLKNG